MPEPIPQRPFALSLGYFGAVFGVGLLLDVARTAFVAPYIGDSVAELIEAPVMLGVITVAAWALARRFRGSRGDLAAIGAFAALLLLVADLGVEYLLRGPAPYGVVTGRITIAGAVHLTLVVLFGALPYLFWRAPAEEAAVPPRRPDPD